MSELATSKIKMLGNLKVARSKHEPKWIDCYKYGAPEREPDFTDVSSDDQKSRVNLYDGTAADSVQLLASSIISGTVPPNVRWFKAVPSGLEDDEMTEADQWLDDVCEMMWRKIHAGNFNVEAYDCIQDYVVGGWGVLYITQDGDGYRFENWPLGNCWFSTSKQGGLVDIIYHVVSMSAKQMVEEYGENEVHESVRRAAKDDVERNYTVLHVVEPRKDGNENADLPEKMPFASYHIDIDNKHLIKEGGYRSFPCAVPRAHKIANSVYAVGQMFKALPDAKSLNEMQRMLLNSMDVNVNGFWAAADDGVINPATFRIGPMEMVMVRSMEQRPQNLMPNTNVNLADWMVSGKQQAIRKVLMSDQLQAQDGPQMTATEVHVRVDLIRQLLGPMFGRLQDEFMMQILDRCFSIGYSAGWFGEAPEELLGEELKFRFENPFARSQRLEEVTAIERLMGSVGLMAEAFPEVLDNINADAAYNVLQAGYGVPASVSRTADQVIKLREQQQQQKQQMEQQQRQQGAEDAMAGAALDVMTQQGANNDL